MFATVPPTTRLIPDAIKGVAAPAVMREAIPPPTIKIPPNTAPVLT